ncbi:type II toxin-antitoxin system Phd/YefM family antitoxin [Ottowia testudinis]|uniref:Type II toxin-antitoxin system Phd/YefM family antitoxin n=1 Tax=Ottowia testudinis TaxID=2816950 RepID=A0A975CIH1_9BURK|nr:type II toxin-antitoxin system Phd/YefM family antitoxin [Ottowia testudinis]QTD45562.1 type II toxin-antitoxin system Phd/YefM family antitoxin [Ottowia testudinis]
MNAPIAPSSLAAPITTYSSREFTRDVAAAKRAAANGPVFITDRGAPAYALLTIEEYHRLKAGSKPRTLLEVMQSLPDTSDIEFEAPRLDDVVLRVPDFDTD